MKNACVFCVGNSAIRNEAHLVNTLNRSVGELKKMLDCFPGVRASTQLDLGNLLA